MEGMSASDLEALRIKQEKEEAEMKEMQEALDRLHKISKMDDYSHIRSEREKATFTMMMKMNPVALTNIRKEFFAREDALTLDEFMFVINKHLVNKNGEDDFVMETPEQREFGANMFELFKDIDINGDGDLEWQEFTTFVVEKANLLNKRQKLASLAHYYDSTGTLDASASYRHRNDISRIVNLPALHQFAMFEDNKRSIFLFNNRLGKHVATVPTDAAPIAMCPLSVGDKGKNIVVSSFSDMTMATYNFESGPSTRYQPVSTWATPGVQMTLAYLPANGLLYSGATNGDVYSWRVGDRKMISTLAGHTDICMSLCVLKRLNYIASASLDKTISVWDSYTNERLLHLHGHKKGILDLTYSPEYRLMVSCGFEHDALVWSPFVKNLVYRLRGHHGALIGVKCVENTPELITADVNGVFKLWDVRKFECVQTFAANLSGTESNDNSRLCCFEYCKLKPRDVRQKEDDSRIYCASKQVLSFDQARVVHAATSDKHMIFQIFWVAESCSFITISERNVIVWDALIGSKQFVNDNMHHEEITAGVLDSRKRKMVIGDALGQIYVYNHLNGQQMKTSSGKRCHSAVISLVYLESEVRFIAGYASGLIRVFDEDPLEDCPVLRTFEVYKMHPELLCIRHDPETQTMLTAGTQDGVMRIWDFSATKCEHETFVAGDRGSVVFACFLSPLPIIATSDSLCNIVLWGSRGTYFKNERICGFMNQTIASAHLEPKKSNDKEEEAPQRSLAPVLDDSILEAEAEALAEFVDDSRKVGNFEATNVQERKKSEEDSKKMIFEAEQHWGKPTAAQSISWDYEKGHLFTADDLGVLRCFNISKAIAEITVQTKPEDWVDDSSVPASTSPVEKGEVADSAGAVEENDNAETEAKAVDETAGSSEEKKLEEKEAEDNRKASTAEISLSTTVIDEEEELDEDKWHCRHNVRGYCRGRARNGVSALPPVPFKCKEREIRYLIPGSNNPAGYHGVDFCWSLQAHSDRIVTCLTTSQGVVTSGADMLVKMWDELGQPLGVLMQSVPVGRRSQKWNCMIDAQEIMDREDQELDEIIADVEDLAVDPERPDIYDMDFTTMEPGANAEDFTRSDLRQRIELTSAKLGIDFPTEGERQEDEVMSLGLLQSPTAGEKPKTTLSALEEVRSTGASSVRNSRKVRSGDRREESEMQKKRREKKFEETSNKYFKLGGMKVGPPGTDSGVLDREINLEEIQAMAGHGADTNATQQLEAKQAVAESTDNDKSVEASSVNFDDLSSLVSSLGLPGSVQGIGDSLAAQIEEKAAQGMRTQSIAKKCAKYENWAKLEMALKSSSKKKKGGVPFNPNAKPRFGTPTKKKRPKNDVPGDGSVVTLDKM